MSVFSQDFEKEKENISLQSLKKITEGVNRYNIIKIGLDLLKIRSFIREIDLLRSYQIINRFSKQNNKTNKVLSTQI